MIDLILKTNNQHFYLCNNINFLLLHPLNPTSGENRECCFNLNLIKLTKWKR